ncbi:hypothetical protein B0T13DRAFT_190795 [Neurospora crassa]|nr:hypothetical protein B0T13DRAFT_190795 [Neurospora crassa]
MCLWLSKPMVAADPRWRLLLRLRLSLLLLLLLLLLSGGSSCRLLRWRCRRHGCSLGRVNVQVHLRMVTGDALRPPRGETRKTGCHAIVDGFLKQGEKASCAQCRKSCACWCRWLRCCFWGREGRGAEAIDVVRWLLA